MTTKFSARLTTRFIDRSTPEFTGSARTLTAHEIVEEYRDLKRGGTFVGVEAIGADGVRVSIGDLEEMAEDDATEDGETSNRRIILDNGGGIILQLGDWAHSYEGSTNARIAKQASDDIREWLKTGNTDRWDGHSADALSVAPTADEIRNGGYSVINIDRDSDTAASLADEVRWGAMGEALGDALAR